jgi:molybdenum cofactor guanylyltransferase
MRMKTSHPFPAAGKALAPLAAILAGGQSRRFGAPKSLAALHGRPLLEWVRDAVRRAVPDPVLITNDADSFRPFGMRSRPDAVIGSGPLGGIHAALRWAAEEARPGALCVACDTPFLPAGLLQLLVERSHGSAADVVVAGSEGKLGVEPLCAVYGVGCIAEIERRLRAGDHSLGGLIGALRTERLPLDEVRRFGDPEILFLNVNTREQFARAARIAEPLSP